MDGEKSNKNVKSSTKNIGLFVGIGLIVLLLLFGVGRSMGVGRSTTTGGRTTMGSPNPVGGGGGGGGGGNEENWLEAHNVIRRLAHNVNDDSVDLEWDEDLAADALVHAEYMAGTGNWGHSGTSSGENLSYTMNSSGPDQSEVETVRRWYDECDGPHELVDGTISGPYDFGTNSLRSSLNALHYSQVVWKGAKKVGCAFALSEDGTKQYGVCNYDVKQVSGDEANNMPTSCVRNWVISE
jgi:hypothetical protein